MGKVRRNNYTTSLTAELFLISCKRPGSLKRLNSILVDRLDVMSGSITNALLNNDINSSRIVLLYIISKTDRLVRDFIVYTYSDKLITRTDLITRVDLDKYMDRVCETEPKILETSDVTKEKIKSVITRLLTSAGLLEKINNDEFRIIRPVISEFTKQSILDDGGDAYLKALGVIL